MPKQVRVDLVEAVELGLGLGRGVVADGLQVDGRVLVVAPRGLDHGEEAAVGGEAEVQHPRGLRLELRDAADRSRRRTRT
jgi:hypothetical protein